MSSPRYFTYRVLCSFRCYNVDALRNGIVQNVKKQMLVMQRNVPIVEGIDQE